MIKALLIALLLIPCVSMAADQCEKEWKSIYEKYVDGSDEDLLKEWEKKKSVCHGSWFFDFKRITTLISAGNNKKAKELAIFAKSQYPDASPFELMLIRLDRIDADPNVIATPAILEKYEQRIIALTGGVITAYPEYKQNLAEIKLLHRDLDSAILLAKEALALKIDSEGGPLLTLTQAYEIKGDYVSAKAALDKLFSLKSDSLLKNNYLLLLSARICAAVGSWEASERALNLAAENSDKGADDPEIQKNIKYIKAKLASGEFKPPVQKTK